MIELEDLAVRLGSLEDEVRARLLVIEDAINTNAQVLREVAKDLENLTQAKTQDKPKENYKHYGS